MKTVLSEIQYLPPVSFFIQLLDYNSLLIEGQENYQKQSYRNRCYILGNNKIQELVVPVKKGNGKILIKDLLIDNDQRWLPVHWGAIKSAYGKSPYFNFFEEYFHRIFFKKHKFLFDLNMELLLLCLQLSDNKVDVGVTEKFWVTGTVPEHIYDSREKIHPKKKTDEGVCFHRYNQLFGKKFIENLSIIDLIFLEGKNSLEIIRKSRIK